MRETNITNELKEGNSVVYFTVGVSMRPLLIERKTHVRIQPIANVSKNDILLYRRKNGDYVLHRLLKIDNHFYYMRGDNTFGLERISHDQAIGSVDLVFRKGKCIDVMKNKRYKAYVMLHNLIYPMRYIMFTTKQCLRKVVKPQLFL